MADANKDTIYIDIDDEITGIIDKLKGSDKKVVALVLPKRASVFQSIVNMKLLKRAADTANKNLVLITTEAGLMPLAGAAGVYVAKTLNSKPEIPAGPDLDDAADEEIPQESIEDDLTEQEDKPLDKAKTVGALAGAGAVGAAAAKAKNKDGVETVELDNADPTPAATGAAKPLKAPKKDKNLKVPDFDRFRLLVIGGIAALILLIVGLVFANKVLPGATISIKTDAKAIEASTDLNLSTTATEPSLSTNTIPAKQVQTQKTGTGSAPATGQKNNGNKASGNVLVTNCSDNDIVVPAGSGLSSGSNTYIAQGTVTIPASNFTSGGNCKNDGKATVGVIAQNGGSSYNLSPGASFTVAVSSRLKGTGSSISGGTDNIVKVISQADINAAKSNIKIDDNSVKQDLKDQLKKQNLYAIEATYQAGQPSYTNSGNVGDQAENVTVTQTNYYTMLGVNQDDLKALIEKAVKEQVDTSKQSIIDYGFVSINFNVTSISATGAQMTVSTTAIVGPQLDEDKIKQDAAGKKPGAVKDEIQAYPGVTSVDVKLHPFWVSSVPNNTSKIKVEIAKPTKPNGN